MNVMNVINTDSRFHVNTTTPKLFVDLAFNSGCISFPCAESERYGINLNFSILLII